MIIYKFLNIIGKLKEKNRIFYNREVIIVNNICYYIFIVVRFYYNIFRKIIKLCVFFK